MKRYIAAVLIPCLLLQLFGCTSFRPLGDGENINDKIKSSSRINLVLENDSIITVNGDECKYITQADFILFGKGSLHNKISRENTSFYGEIDKRSIDSTKYVIVDSIEYLICWINGIERISFEKRDFVFNSNLNPDSSYWLIKDYDAPKLIPANQLSAIEVEELNWFFIIPAAVIIIALMVGFGALVSGLPRGELKFE